jgi:signal transduction histidine kinase
LCYVFCRNFLQNSLKHAACSRLKFCFQKEQDGLTIRVIDNGKGFAANDTSYNGSRFKKHERKEPEIIGGNLIIESSPGVGTKMYLFIPANKLNK